MRLTYTRTNGDNKGGIYENAGIYVAFTQVFSRNFKTLNGAKRFMARHDYVEVK